jgi:hypothetical protein
VRAAEQSLVELGSTSGGTSETRKTPIAREPPHSCYPPDYND